MKPTLRDKQKLQQAAWAEQFPATAAALKARRPKQAKHLAKQFSLKLPGVPESKSPLLVVKHQGGRPWTGRKLHTVWIEESIWVKIADEAEASKVRPSVVLEQYAEIIWHLREAGIAA